VKTKTAAAAAAEGKKKHKPQAHILVCFSCV